MNWSSRSTSAPESAASDLAPVGEIDCMGLEDEYSVPPEEGHDTQNTSPYSPFL